MIVRDDILSMEFLKKTEFTACHKGMRYRLEKATNEEGEQKLLVTVWPEPYNFVRTPDHKKTSAWFAFEEEGVVEAVAWMNERWQEKREKWENSYRDWDSPGDK